MKDSSHLMARAPFAPEAAVAAGEVGPSARLLPAATADPDGFIVRIHGGAAAAAACAAGEIEGALISSHGTPGAECSRLEMGADVVATREDAANGDLEPTHRAAMGAARALELGALISSCALISSGAT